MYFLGSEYFLENLSTPNFYLTSDLKLNIQITWGGGRLRLPKDVLALVPKTCECARFYGN
jgi:hypothetical protein